MVYGKQSGVVLTKNTFCITLNAVRFECVFEQVKGKRIMGKRITVTNTNSKGRNTAFHDNATGANMTRSQFVKQIKNGNYENYHVRNINGVDTPVSNPDRSTNNNLG